MDLDGFHQKNAVAQHMTSSDDERQKKWGAAWTFRELTSEKSYNIYCFCRGGNVEGKFQFVMKPGVIHHETVWC